MDTPTLRKEQAISMKHLSAKIAEGYQFIADNPNETNEWYRTMSRDLIKYTELLEKTRNRYMMITINCRPDNHEKKEIKKL